MTFPDSYISEEQHFLLQDIRKEYEQGFKICNSLGHRTVTFYGGARVVAGSSTYLSIYELAKAFALQGWGVITGGGPGVMSAALRGAADGGGKGAAFRISIIDEKPDFETDLSYVFNHFSVRKYMLRQANAFVYAPGGIGTLDELMENLTLIKTGKYPKKPIFLYDGAFWKGYTNWFQETLLGQNLVTQEMLNMFQVVSSKQEVMDSLFPKTSRSHSDSWQS